MIVQQEPSGFIGKRKSQCPWGAGREGKPLSEQHKRRAAQEQRCERLWLSGWETSRSLGLSQHLPQLPQELDQLQEQIPGAGREGAGAWAAGRRRGGWLSPGWGCWVLCSHTGRCHTVPVPCTHFWSQAVPGRAGFGHTLLSALFGLLGRMPAAVRWTDASCCAVAAGAPAPCLILRAHTHQ